MSAVVDRPVAAIEGLSTTGGSLASAAVFAGEAVPFCGGVASPASRPLPPSPAGRELVDRVLRPRQPDLLAAGAAHGAAGRAQGSQIDGIGCCTMGANDVHGANLHNDAARMLQGDR